MANTKEISSLLDITSRYDGYIIDLDGVMYSNDKVHELALDVLKNLKSQGKKVSFLSNSSKRVKDVALKINAMGITRDLYDGILTSGEIVYYDLKNKTDSFFKKVGRRYYYIGNPRNRLEFESASYDYVANLNDADFIIVGDITDKNDDINNYMTIFQEALVKSLPMVCASSDRISLAQGNITMMGAGYVAAKYSKMGGYVVFRGKPNPEVFMYCMEGMGIEDKSQVIMIGDNFETDIMGGFCAGVSTLFISGGVHSRELRAMPNESADAKRLDELFRNYGVFPDFVLPYLK